MRKHITIILVACATLCGYSHGAIGFTFTFGTAYASDGTTPIPEGTLWVMIVDDGDGILPGGLEINSSLNSNEDEAAIAADFNGVTIAKGTLIGNDRIFDFGGFDAADPFGGVGLASGTGNYTVGPDPSDDFSSADIGESFGFYWFPGVSINGSLQLGTIVEVGGISDQTQSDEFRRMVIPGNNTLVSPLATTSNIGAGTFTDDRFTAVEIPPSGYQIWRDLKFNQSQIDAGDADPTSDPDKDGLKNLLEYATSTPPLQASPGPLVIRRSGDSAVLEFSRIADAGLRYRVAATDDLTLSSWPDVAFESSGSENIEELVSFSQPLAPAARFFRLEVESLVNLNP